MIRRFAFSGLQMAPHPAYQRPAAGRPFTSPVPPPALPNPLLPLLTSLRGRLIGVTTSQREVEGRLVLADPVTLVGTDGTTTLVALDRVLSVRF